MSLNLASQSTFGTNLLTRIMPAKVARSRLGRAVYLASGYCPPDLAEELIDALRSSLWVESELRLEHVTPYGAYDLGVVSRKVITDAGAAAVVNAFRNTFELELFNYHGLGTGSTAEAAAQTALVTELTTQYSTDNTRPTGTQSAPAANQYQSVATITVDAAVSITEHALFSQAAAPGGQMWDRSVFAALALNSGDSIIATYIATVTSGG
jgi:hypothetical protein